jgi:hypothetical protein
MPYSFSNRKKIRGWKKLADKINHLKIANLKINRELLEKYGRDYVKLTISPWSNLTKRNPPFWYRRLFLDALVEIYENWDEQLKEISPKYYLKIWLFHPRFHQTQIVAAIGEKVTYYENLFLVNEKLKNKPPSEHDSNRFKADMFQWQTCFDTEIVCEKEDELDKRSIEYCKSRSVLIEQKDGDTIYFVNKGNLWVGEKIK